MPDSVITLTTDFGQGSPYVAAMKGVILGVNPHARILDLSHQIPPQNLGIASLFLAATIPYFPKDALHVIVIDPGVGADRALLFVEVDGHRLLVPDNGCWSELEKRAGRPPKVIRLAESRFWSPSISPTFHGRDILAPVAAHLSLGLDPKELGPPINSWTKLEIEQPEFASDHLTGRVTFVDHFGNLITNIPGEALGHLTGSPRIHVERNEIKRRVRVYADAEPGALVWLISSFGLVEIAETLGNAAKRLNAEVGSRVRVTATSAIDP